MRKFIDSEGFIRLINARNFYIACAVVFIFILGMAYEHGRMAQVYRTQSSWTDDLSDGCIETRMKLEEQCKNKGERLTQFRCFDNGNFAQYRVEPVQPDGAVSDGEGEPHSGEGVQ